MPALLAIDDLHVSFETDRGRTGILHGISLDLEPGQTIGVVGESGSGKTVLVRAVLGLLDAPFAIDGGRIEYQGADLLSYGERELERIRGREIALTTPEPRKHLNPLTTVGDQIAKVIRAHSDMSKEAAMARAVELLGMVGIPDPELRLAGYPHEMSGGMCQRIIIAMALAHDSKILLIDEPTAGLDVTISRQILDLIRGLVRERGVAALIVSRDLGVVAHYCRDVAVMYAGRIVERAGVETFFRKPLHPYSARLLRAAAAARDQAVGRSEATALLPPAAHGCSYAPRCPLAEPACEASVPDPAEPASGRWVRCLRAAAIANGEVAV